MAQRIGAVATLAKPLELSELTKLLVKFLEPAEIPMPLPDSPAPVPDLTAEPEVGPA